MLIVKQIEIYFYLNFNCLGMIPMDSSTPNVNDKFNSVYILIINIEKRCKNEEEQN